MKEEDSHLDDLKENLIRTSDIDSSNVVYQNNLKFHSAQSLELETQGKIRAYLNDHISNFKPLN